MGPEAELAREFPKLYEFCTAHEARRPQRDEHWERSLRLARNSEPILSDLKMRGLDLVQLNSYSLPERHRQTLYETLMDWLPRVEDSLTLSVCLATLGEPGARTLIKKNRETLLSLARKWNKSGTEEIGMLAVLAGRVMSTALQRDVPEIVNWAKDNRLDIGARSSYVLDLQRFAKKPGPARDALMDFLKDEGVGNAAVWAIAGAMKAEALPLLRELQQSSPNESVRKAASFTTKKLEAKLGRVTLRRASPAELPNSYVSTSIEFDTDRVPALLASIEEGLGGCFRPDDSSQLALSANQMKRGEARFHIVPLDFLEGSSVQLGLGFYAEDSDAIVVELHFDASLCDAVDSMLSSFTDGQ